LDNGTEIAWMPGGKTLHVINPKGEKFEMTPAQLGNLATKLKERKDPTGDQVLDFLAAKAREQMARGTNSPAGQTSQPASAPSTQQPDPLGLYK
jgi:hypothetical protein